MNDLAQSPHNHARGDVCVLVAAEDGDEDAERCVRSVRAHSDDGLEILRVQASAAAVNRALAVAAPADVVVLAGCAGVGEGWLARLAEAARADTNTATASALSDAGGPFALGRRGAGGIEALAAELASRTRALRPRLTRAVGPCVYVRREAIELVGALDEELDLSSALELDFTQRCLLAGLAHVAADNVVVERAERARESPPPSTSPTLLARYPYLADAPALGESAMLEEALAAVREPHRPLPVTIDARSLGATITGTQVNIIELIGALSRTGELGLRVLVRPEQMQPDTLTRLRSLAGVELLAESELSATTPPTRIFHRPQQAFAAEDVAIAAALGERIVLSQLDLIAYRNPGYFPDAPSWQDYRRASRHGLAAADRVVVFSEHTRAELLGDGLVAAERVAVVPPGLDHGELAFGHGAAAQPRRPAGLDAGDTAAPADGFLLCLGTDFRHKNRLFAIGLLARLRDEHGWRGSLVLAGTHIPNGSSLELERELLAERPELDEAIVTLGAVEEEEKAWLLAHAGAVLYPSAYEGFGMVPFESALAGVPCLFAAQSSLAEVAPPGTATILPWDLAQSARAAHALLTDEARRAEHLAALAAAARELTWDRAARAMLETYRQAAAAPAREAATLARDALAREARLTAAHQAVVERLIGERRHAQRMYEELNAEVGFGLSLIGPNGALGENLQRALLSVSAHPRLARALFGALARVFVAVRAIGRALPGASRRERARRP